MLEHLINTLNAETVVSVVGQELGFFNTSSGFFFSLPFLVISFNREWIEDEYFTI